MNKGPLVGQQDDHPLDNLVRLNTSLCECLASDVTQSSASGNWIPICVALKFVMHFLILNTTLILFAMSLKMVMYLLSTKHDIYNCHTQLFAGLFDNV